MRYPIIRAAAMLFAFFVGFNAAYNYGTARTIDIEVTGRERMVTSGQSNDSYWVIFTRNADVLRNSDSWLWLKFNSSSVQARLEPGRTYTVRVYGWRIAFFSMYPNIIEIVN